MEGNDRRGRTVRLRPMAESDWDILTKWNNDPRVLYYAEGGDITSRTVEEVQELYRGVSATAFCFIIEIDGQPIGECWLQKMNLDRILRERAGLDCRRIDLMIGEKHYWGQGIGTVVIRLLTEFGFSRESADMIFGCDIADYNVRSLRAFQRVGYQIVSKIEEKPGGKSKYNYDVALTKAQFADRKVD